VIAVLCPTRRGPDALKLLAKSVADTSNARVLAYVDDDSREAYRHGWGQNPGQFVDAMARTFIYEGPRIGPVASMNVLVNHYLDQFDIFGMVPDDATFETAGWDRRMEEVAASFQGGIGAMSPKHSLGDHVDIPFVTRRWIDILGWFAYPGFYHWGWPTVISALAEGIQSLVHLPEESCFVRHDHLEPMKSGHLA